MWQSSKLAPLVCRFGCVMVDPLSLFYCTHNTRKHAQHVGDTQNGAFKANIWQRFHLSIRERKMAEGTTSHTNSALPIGGKVRYFTVSQRPKSGATEVAKHSCISCPCLVGGRRRSSSRFFIPTRPVVERWRRWWGMEFWKRDKLNYRKTGILT